jgi:ribosomal protein S27AE
MEAVMEVDELEIVEMELKYCERCGSLWMRLHGDGGVYCAKCAPQMAELPLPRRLKRVEAELEVSLGEHAFLCGEGGNA